MFRNSHFYHILRRQKTARQYDSINIYKYYISSHAYKVYKNIYNIENQLSCCLLSSFLDIHAAFENGAILLFGEKRLILA